MALREIGPAGGADDGERAFFSGLRWGVSVGAVAGTFVGMIVMALGTWASGDFQRAGLWAGAFGGFIGGVFLGGVVGSALAGRERSAGELRPAEAPRRAA